MGPAWGAAPAPAAAATTAPADLLLLLIPLQNIPRQTRGCRSRRGHKRRFKRSTKNYCAEAAARRRGEDSGSQVSSCAKEKQCLKRLRVHCGRVEGGRACPLMCLSFVRRFVGCFLGNGQERPFSILLHLPRRFISSLLTRSLPLLAPVATPPPAVMADSTGATRSSATIKAPLSFSHIFDINLTPDVLAVAKPKADVIYSSPFGHGEYGTFQVAVYIGGLTEEAQGHISIFLMLEKGGSSLPVAAGGGAEASFTLSTCGITDSAKARIFTKVRSKYGWTRFASHEEVASWLRGKHENRIEVKATIQPIGKLIITETTAAPDLRLSTPPPVLSGKLRALLSSGERADCTLVCGGAGERLQAHTFILSLRSPVFAAQLSCSDPAGGGGLLAALDLSAVPVPEDIEPPVMRRLLEHLYTDEEVEFSDANEAR